MSTASIRLVPRRWLELSGQSARLRLTLMYSGMFLVLGTAVIVIIFVVVELDEPRIELEQIERLVGIGFGHAHERLAAEDRRAAAKSAEAFERDVAHDGERARVDAVVAQERDSKTVGDVGLEEDGDESAFDALGRIDEMAHAVQRCPVADARPKNGTVTSDDRKAKYRG